MIIYMKNGAVIKTADNLDKVRRDNMTGSVVGLDWTHHEGECLYYIDPKEIIAIVDDFQSESGTTPVAADKCPSCAGKGTYQIGAYSETCSACHGTGILR